MGLREDANKIDSAVKAVLKENKYVTGDLGGKYGCTDYTKAIIDNLNWFFFIYFYYNFI